MVFFVFGAGKFELALAYFAAIIDDCSLTRCGGGVIDTHGNNVGRREAQNVRPEYGIDQLASVGKGLNVPPDLDKAWLPWRQDIVHNISYTPVAQGIAKLLAGHDVDTTQVNGILVRVVAKTTRYNVEIAIAINGCNSPYPLALKVFNFG